jgi:hypothetical protein
MTFRMHKYIVTLIRVYLRSSEISFRSSRFLKVLDYLNDKLLELFTEFRAKADLGGKENEFFEFLGKFGAKADLGGYFL